MISDNRRIESLTGARFVAIMIIVFSHFEFLKGYGYLGEIYWNFFHNATLRVVFFFALSGFGMMLSSMRKDPAGTGNIGGLKGLINFWKRHVQKIYPAYIIFLFLGIPYMFLENLEIGKTILNSLVRCAKYIPLDLFLLQSATGKMSFSHSFNGVCWFLSCLFCIYLISPIIMKLLKRYVKTSKMAIKGIVLCIIISCILAFIFEWIDKYTFFDDLAYGSPYRRVFYVIPGMLLAQIYVFYKYYRSLFNDGLFEYVSIGSAAIWFLFRNFIITYLGLGIYVIDMVIVCCVLFALSLEKGVCSVFLSSKSMVYFGNISMYIFLSHYNIRMYLDYLVRNLKMESITVGMIEVLAILALTLFISSFIHYYRMKSLSN